MTAYAFSWRRSPPIKTLVSHSHLTTPSVLGVGIKRRLTNKSRIEQRPPRALCRSVIFTWSLLLYYNTNNFLTQILNILYGLTSLHLLYSFWGAPCSKTSVLTAPVSREQKTTTYLRDNIAVSISMHIFLYWYDIPQLRNANNSNLKDKNLETTTVLLILYLPYPGTDPDPQILFEVKQDNL